MEKRRKIMFALIAAVSLLATLLATYALTTFTFNTNFNVQPPSTPNFEVYVNGTARTETFDLEFGTVEAGKIANVTVDIHNLASFSTRFTLSALMNDPVATANWVITYSANNTVAAAAGWINGTLTYNIASDTAAPSAYGGNVTITAAKV